MRIPTYCRDRQPMFSGEVLVVCKARCYVVSSDYCTLSGQETELQGLDTNSKFNTSWASWLETIVTK